MELSRLKSLTIPEGEVKEILIGGVSVWKCEPVEYGIEITTGNTEAITDYYVRDECSKTFTAEYSVPRGLRDTPAEWTAEGLPSGLSAVSLTGDSLTIRGAATIAGTYAVKLSVSKGNYSASKEYELEVTDRGHIEITTSNAESVKTFYIRDQCSKTFYANYTMPSTESSTTPSWTVSGLPSGLSASSLTSNNLTISGAAGSTGTYTVTLTVRRGIYSASREYKFEVTDRGKVEITTSNANEITEFYVNKTASYTFYASYTMPSTETNTTPEWTVTGLPSTITAGSLNGTSLTISGYNGSSGTSRITVTLKRGSYTDTKQYTLRYTSDGYGLTVDTSSLIFRKDQYNQSQELVISKTLPANYGVTVYADNLPSGLYVSGTSIAGRPSSVSTVASIYATASSWRSPVKSVNISVTIPPPGWYSYAQEKTSLTIDCSKIREDGCADTYISFGSSNSSALLVYWDHAYSGCNDDRGQLAWSGQSWVDGGTETAEITVLSGYMKASAMDIYYRGGISYITIWVHLLKKYTTKAAKSVTKVLQAKNTHYGTTGSLNVTFSIPAAS